jgi:hypothetical protein
MHHWSWGRKANTRVKSWPFHYREDWSLPHSHRYPNGRGENSAAALLLPGGGGAPVVTTWDIGDGDDDGDDGGGNGDGSGDKSCAGDGLETKIEDNVVAVSHAAGQCNRVWCRGVMGPLRALCAPAPVNSECSLSALLLLCCLATGGVAARALVGRRMGRRGKGRERKRAHRPRQRSGLGASACMNTQARQKLFTTEPGVKDSSPLCPPSLSVCVWCGLPSPLGQVLTSVVGMRPSVWHALLPLLGGRVALKTGPKTDSTGQRVNYRQQVLGSGSSLGLVVDTRKHTTRPDQAWRKETSNGWLRCDWLRPPSAKAARPRRCITSGARQRAPSLHSTRTRRTSR